MINLNKFLLVKYTNIIFVQPRRCKNRSPIDNGNKDENLDVSQYEDEEEMKNNEDDN